MRPACVEQRPTPQYLRLSQSRPTEKQQNIVKLRYNRFFYEIVTIIHPVASKELKKMDSNSPCHRQTMDQQEVYYQREMGRHPC